jgi:hypothetical protein
MAADIITPALKWFFEIGFGNVLVFILVTAIFYAVFRKSKVLGDSEMINGVVAIVAAFFVGFWLPIFTGFSFVSSMSAFFAQSTAILLFFIISFMLAGFFYPDLTGMLMDQFKSRHTLFIMLVFGVLLLVISTMVTSFWSVFPPAAPGSLAPNSDLLIITAAVIVFVVILVIASGVTGGG